MGRKRCKKAEPRRIDQQVGACHARLPLLESFCTCLYVSKFLQLTLKVDYFKLTLSSQEMARSGWVGSFLKSLLNTGLNFKENGIMPYMSHLYLQETSSRLSILCLNVLGLVATREHEMASRAAWFQSPIFFMFYQVFQKRIPNENKEARMKEIYLDHLSKYIFEFDTTFYMTQWLETLCAHIRNPYDSGNTILPGSMKKVGACDY